MLPGSTGRRGYHHTPAISRHDVQLVLHVVHIKVVLTRMIEVETKIGMVVTVITVVNCSIGIGQIRSNWDRTNSSQIVDRLIQFKFRDQSGIGTIGTIFWKEEQF